MARDAFFKLPRPALACWAVSAICGVLAPAAVSAAMPPFDASVRVLPTANTHTLSQIGRMAGIRVIDRESGAALPIYEYQGEYWVVGTPGKNYAISMQKRAGPGRALLVTSVDGINVISGQTAAYDQTGYVLSGYGQFQITGWRKSLQEVAAFTFATPGESYAAKTGRAGHIGVIGVAVFREREERPVLPGISRPEQEWKGAAGSGAARKEAPAESRASSPARPDGAANAAEAGASGSSPAARDSADARERSMAAAPMAPGLGTQHGQRERSVTQNVSFVRASDAPDEVISLRYDSVENMVRRGVLAYAPPEPGQGGGRVPLAFPKSAGFVPDPPGYR